MCEKLRRRLSMTKEFVEDVFSRIPEGVKTGIFGEFSSTKGDAEICVLCDGDWCTVAFTFGDGGEKVVEDFDAVVERAAKSAGKDNPLAADGGSTVNKRRLAEARDKLAGALRERDSFKTHSWNEVFLKGPDGASLWLRDPRLMKDVLALCAELFDRKVAEARDTLEIVGVEAFKKERQS